MAAPSEPLGMLWEAFLSYFTPPFLAAALVLGYVMFFLFFYKTEHWNSLDWTERFFFGFLVGIFSMIVCTFVSLPLAFLLFSLYMGAWFNTAFYLIPIFFLMFLVFLRIDLRAPLSSNRANRFLRAVLRTHRSYWPYFLITISAVAYFWLGWNNPFFESASSFLWLSFIITLNFTVFLTFCVLTWFVVQLSSVSAKMSTMTVLTLPYEVLQFCFFSFLRKKRRISIEEEDVYWV
jgi:hypothetical protein